MVFLTEQTKRYRRVLAAAVLLLMTVTGFATTTNTNGSALEKECKKVYKQLKQAGWTVLDGSSTDLKAALTGRRGATLDVDRLCQQCEPGQDKGKRPCLEGICHPAAQ